MTIWPFIVMIALCLAFLGLLRRRPVLEARPNGVMIYRGLQTAVALAWVSLLCWQLFAMGFEMGGDVARRDARAEARAEARTGASVRLRPVADPGSAAPQAL